jgi:hypothetical protein
MVGQATRPMALTLCIFLRRADFGIGRVARPEHRDGRDSACQFAHALTGRATSSHSVCAWVARPEHRDGRDSACQLAHALTGRATLPFARRPLRPSAPAVCDSLHVVCGESERDSPHSHWPDGSIYSDYSPHFSGSSGECAFFWEGAEAKAALAVSTPPSFLSLVGIFPGNQGVLSTHGVGGDSHTTT